MPPNNGNVPVLLSRIAGHAKRAPHKIAVVDKSGEAFSYQALDRYATHVAGHLVHRGIKPGQAVAIVAEPCFGFVAAQLGAWRAGAVTVPLCPEHPIAEQKYIVSDSTAKAVVALQSYDQAKGLGIPVLDQAELLSKHSFADVHRNSFESSPVEDTATLIYTSGSTGRPKGVVTTFDALDAMVSGMEQAWRWTEDDFLLHFLPLHHMHGAVNKLLTPLAVGAKVEFIHFNARAVLDRLSAPAGAPTVFHAVPTVYTKLLEAYDANEHRRASQLKLYVCGSAPLPEPVFDRFLGVTGHRILERWGMTELGMGISNPYEPVENRLPGYVGLPMPGVEISIRNEAGNELVKPGQAGLLMVRGRQVFRKYWRRSAEEMAKEFEGDGWFNTGDIAMLDPKVNSVKIVGRASVDIIKTAGYKVSAIDIEREVLGHPSVSEVAVFGISNAVYGEVPAAVVGLKKGAELSGEELAAWLKDKLAHYKIPKKYVFMDAIPRNAMQKVNKKELRKVFDRR